MKMQIIGEDGPNVKPEGFGDIESVHSVYKSPSGKTIVESFWAADIVSLEELQRLVAYYGHVELRQMSNGYLSISIGGY